MIPHAAVTSFGEKKIPFDPVIFLTWLEEFFSVNNYKVVPLEKNKGFG